MQTTIKKILAGALHAAAGGALNGVVAAGLVPGTADYWQTVGALAFSGMCVSLYAWYQRSPREMWDEETERRKR